MGWIYGSESTRTPRGGRSLWEGPPGKQHVWVIDEDGFTTVRTCESDGVRLAVIGDVWVSEDDLRRALPDVRRGAWRDLTRWPGSYWVIAQHQNRTVVISDLAGVRPVFYARRHGRIVWATEAKPLAALVDSGIDYAGIIRAMTVPTLGDLAGTSTTFYDVNRVPGGHCLYLDAAIAHVGAYEPPGQGTAFSDGTDLLQEALVDAVTARAWNIAGPISSDFSGGLDSTTLGLLAAHTGRDVLGVTLQDAASPNDDVSYAMLAAGADARIDHRIVTPEPSLALFDDLASAPVTDQPCADAARWARTWSYQQIAADAGSQMHLTGAGGDLLLTAPSTSLADLASEGRYLALWRVSVAEARRRHVAAHEVFNRAVRLSRVAYTAALTDLAVRIATPDDAPSGISWLRPSGVASWLTRDARAMTVEAVKELAERAHDYVMDMSARNAWDEVREFGPYFTGLTQQADALGYRVTAPFLDNEVIRAAMAVPVHEHLHRHRQKPLLAAAMRGRVPDRLLDRRTKGMYNAAGYVGLVRNLPHIKGLLSGSELVADGLLDAAAITRDVDLMASGIPTRQFAALESVITAELWLSQHRATPAANLWETTHARA